MCIRDSLYPAEQAALEAQFNVLPAAQQTTLTNLLTEVRRLARDFFDNQLRKQPLRLEGEAGFLEEADFDDLFAPLTPLQAFAAGDSDAELAAKRAANEAISRANEEELRRRRGRIAQALSLIHI